jgi:hypothetical protein
MLLIGLSGTLNRNQMLLLLLLTSCLARIARSFASGGYRGNADTLLGLIDDSETNRVKLPFRVNTTLVLETLTLDTNTALGMIDTGYGDLNTYLNANQIDPYANLQQQVSPVNNAMADYLSAYGVSNDPVNQQVQASQMANQEGANSL